MTNHHNHPFSNAVVIGGGRIACDCLNLLANTGLTLHAVLTDQSPFALLEKTARKIGCPFTKTQHPAELTQLFQNISKPTLVVSANNHWIFPPNVLHRPNLKIINYHNSLLPKHRGRNAPTWAIYAGDANAGASWHLVDQGIDTGPLLAQKNVPIHPHTTAVQLVAACMQAASELFKNLLPSLLNWNLSPQPITSQTHEYHRGTDVPNHGLLNTSWDFNQTSRFLRALDYGPLNVLPVPKLLLPNLDPQQLPLITKYDLHLTSTPAQLAPSQNTAIHTLVYPQNIITLSLRYPPDSPKFTNQPA
jgi:methionyl-tRNA formyltransferase